MQTRVDYNKLKNKLIETRRILDLSLHNDNQEIEKEKEKEIEKITSK